MPLGAFGVPAPIPPSQEPVWVLTFFWPLRNSPWSDDPRGADDPLPRHVLRVELGGGVRGEAPEPLADLPRADAAPHHRIASCSRQPWISENGWGKSMGWEYTGLDEVGEVTEAGDPPARDLLDC